MILLRTVGPNGESHGGFTWPLTVGAEVVAPDWNPKPVCGGGLHGLDPLTGDWSLLDWQPTARPLVIEADDSDVVAIDTAKHKARRVIVREVGEPGTLYSVLCRLICDPERIAALVATITADAASGYGSTLAASGYDSTLAASGYDSTLAASGDGSTLAASGDGSTLAASGDGSQLAASGYGSRLAASGYDSNLAASGAGSRLAASGYGSTLAASGDNSRLAASGDDSLILAAHGATAQAGERGCIALAWWDGARHRVSVAYVGEDGIEPNVAYRLDECGRFVKVTA